MKIVKNIYAQIYAHQDKVGINKLINVCLAQIILFKLQIEAFIIMFVNQNI